MRASWTRIHTMLLGIILTVVLLLLLENLGSISNSVSALFKPKYGTVGPRSSGQSASWADMLAVAQAEAQKVDKGSLLDDSFLFARPAGDEPLWASTFTNYSSSLALALRFVTSKGDDVFVTMEDAEPSSTALHYAYASRDTEGYKQLQERSEWLDKLLARTKLTPRDAVQRTWDEAKQRAVADGLQSITIIPQGVHHRIYKGTLPVWEVDYTVENPTWKTPIAADKPDKFYLFSAFFVVNAETGEIIERTFDQE